MESGRDGDKNKINNLHFDENRKKIEEFFLKNAVKEFHDVQGVFHLNMVKVVKGFDSVKNQFPNNIREVIIELLKPYRVLTKNPFRSPTGNLKNDLEAILRAIKDQNEEFKKTLAAALEAISNLERFNAVLKECEDKKEIVQEVRQQFQSVTHETQVNRIKEEDVLSQAIPKTTEQTIKTPDQPPTPPEMPSWLHVQAAVEHPVRHVMQYPILIKGIEKNVPPDFAASRENLAVDISATMSYLEPEIRNIEENKEVIKFLNKIEGVLCNLLADEILKQESSSSILPFMGSNEQKNETSGEKFDTSLREKIQFILLTLKKGKHKIIQGNQDVISLYHGILDLLNDLQKNYPAEENKNKSLLSSATSYAASTGYYLLTMPVMFFNPPKNNSPAATSPLATSDLASIIKELNETTTKTEELRDIFQDLIEKKAQQRLAR